MKNTVILMLTGAILGIVLASYIVPPAIAWYTEPGGLPGGANVQALVQIPEVIRYATSKLLRGQMIGAVIGAAGGLALGIMWARRRARPPASPAPVQRPTPTK
jgi:hypothetical protein